MSLLGEKRYVIRSAPYVDGEHGNEHGSTEDAAQRSKTRYACQDHGYLAEAWLTMIPLSRSGLTMIHGTLVKIMAR